MLVCYLITVVGFSGCGSVEFDGGTTSRLSDGTYTGQKVDNLTWFWQCASAPADSPVTNKSSVVINDGGEHWFKSKSFDKTPLIFSGKVCPPVTYPRDILFLIDTSESMSDNDRRAGGTCGRLKAVEAIMNDVSQRGGNSRFGIITFSTKVNAKSSTLHRERGNLFADIAPGGSISDIICANAGNTSYGPPLAEAEKILKGSRPGAIKEIYFISDGIPSNPADDFGGIVAERLRTEGIAIGGKSQPVAVATVMLGDADDEILKNKIATRPELHRGSVLASDLAATLGKLAENDIKEGKVKYRSDASDPWTEIDIFPYLQDYSFSLPAISFDRALAPNGLEVVFEYRDRHENIFSSQGKISWTDVRTQ
jgi:hypothetical protein